VRTGRFDRPVASVGQSPSSRSPRPRHHDKEHVEEQKRLQPIKTLRGIEDGWSWSTEQGIDRQDGQPDDPRNEKRGELPFNVNILIEGATK